MLKGQYIFIYLSSIYLRRRIGFMLKRPLLSTLLPYSFVRNFFLKKELEKINYLTNYIIDTVLYFDNYLITPNQARRLALKHFSDIKIPVIKGSVR